MTHPIESYVVIHLILDDILHKTVYTHCPVLITALYKRVSHQRSHSLCKGILICSKRAKGFRECNITTHEVLFWNGIGLEEWTHAQYIRRDGIDLLDSFKGQQN